jgi:hypothetical protein
MSSAKSIQALSFNTDLIFQGGDVRFWTFTLPLQLHPKEGALMWQDLCRELKRSLGFCGVRVFELHPLGHGLHVHVMTNGWYNVNEVRSVCRRMGWGRLNVVLWEGDSAGAAAYLAKYMRKQAGLFKGFGLKGVRWWGCFGVLSDRVRVKDVKCVSFFSEIFNGLPAWFVCAFGSVKYPIQGDRVSSSRFNLAKMRIAKQIYYLDDLMMGCCSGFMDRVSLGFDVHILRRGAWFLSQDCCYPL